MFNVCPFDYKAVAGSGQILPANRLTIPDGWLLLLQLTVRNCCVIELFVALFVFSLFPFDISVGIRVFVIGLSQISSILVSYR